MSTNLDSKATVGQCLDIRAFHDGQRLILTVENMPFMSKETIINSFLKGVSANLISEEDAEAEPMPAKEEEPIPETPKPVFTSGAFKGLTPQAVFDRCKTIQDREKVNVEMAKIVDMMEGEIRQDIINAARKYMKERFGDVKDPYQYVMKLKDEQVVAFYARYAAWVLPETKKLILTRFPRCLNWTEFLFLDVAVMRENASEIICAFKAQP